MTMEQTRKLLLGLFTSIVTLSLLLMLAFATGVMCRGALAEETQLVFVAECVMELLTLLFGWFALRLFKWKKVHTELVEGGAVALQKWGVLRLTMLELPLLLNVLCYGLFDVTAFFYLAVILLVCLVFVYPSAGRCISEIEP